MRWGQINRQDVQNHIYIYMRDLYLSRQLRETLSAGAMWLNFNHNFGCQYHGRSVIWGLWWSRSVFMRTAAMIAVIFKDCDQGHSLQKKTATCLFLRTATMVAVQITLKIYDFLGLRPCYSGLRPCCSKFATILKWQLRESLSADGWGTFFTHTRAHIYIYVVTVPQPPADRDSLSWRNVAEF